MFDQWSKKCLVLGAGEVHDGAHDRLDGPADLLPVVGLRVGQILVKRWSITGQIRVKYGSNIGQKLVKKPVRPTFFPLSACGPVKYWSNAGQILVKCWSNTGQTRAECDDSPAELHARASSPLTSPAEPRSVHRFSCRIDPTQSLIFAESFSRPGIRSSESALP